MNDAREDLIRMRADEDLEEFGSCVDAVEAIDRQLRAIPDKRCREYKFMMRVRHILRARHAELTGRWI